MISDNNKEQQLFDSLRNSPTEFSLGDVENIIKKLPTLPTPPKDKNDWTDFFNLKNIIMISIPISIAIALSVFNTSDKIATTNTDITESPKEITLNTRNDVEELATIEKEPITELPKVIQPKRQVLIPQTTLIPEPTIQDNIVVPQVNQTIPVDDSNDKPVVQKEAPKKDITRQPRRGANIEFSIPKPELSPIPHFKNLELRKLKRSLYKNLKQDGLIGSKSEFVEIKLLGSGIIVNGTLLDAKLFLKYSGITSKVGTGPDRMIKLDKKYIKVGDFTPTGFKGQGYGTFTETFDGPDDGFFGNDSNEEGLIFENSDDKVNNIFSEEHKQVDEFANQFLVDSPNYNENNRLNNLRNYRKTTLLQSKLYSTLLEDNIINSKEDFVLVELPKNTIRINGQNLNANLYSKYRGLFSEFKIKSGNQLQIRMSEHSIRVGNFSKGHFSGTSTIIK